MTQGQLSRRLSYQVVVTELHLSSDRQWVGSGTVAVRGRAFRGDDRLTGDSLCENFVDVATLEGFAETLDALNGFFAVVVDGADGVLLGVDHVRSVPLVYAPAPDHAGGTAERAGDATWLAGDDATAIAERLDSPYDPLSESEFLVSGGVLDDRTLFPELRTVRPGEAVRLADGGTDSIRYTDFRPRVDETSDTGTDDDRAVRERLETGIDAAFDRFAEVVDDRQVAVALSGGYDSRLLVTELARREVDLLAYSFGRPDAEDVTVARDVAAALEVPWEFVEYSTEQWGAWYRSAERPAYVEHAFTYDTIPNYGSLPAVSRLRQRGVIDDDAVCSSGQTIVGVSENVPHEIEVSEPTRADLVDATVRYLARWQWENPAFDAALRSRVEASIPGDAVASLPDAFARFEHWKRLERHTKYFLGDVRQYDFHGLDWWLPLWDRAIVDAWAAVPFADRREKRLYKKVVDRRFAAATGLSREEATEMTVQTSAPSFAGRLLDSAAERIVDSPVAPLLRGVYWRLQRRRSDYGDHPLGWYGILTPDLFAQLYSGREDIHALQTLEAVGRASFVDGTVTEPPRDGVLSLPYTGEDAP